jgi:hypothetical protein
MTRRRGRRLAAAVLVALVAIAAVALPGIVRRITIRLLASATDRTVTLEAVELELFRGRLALRGLRVLDRDGGPLATLERLDLRFRPRDLLRGHLHVTDAALQGVTARVVRTGPGELNVSDLLRRRGGGGGRLPGVTLDRFALLGGAVTIEDRALAPPRTWRVQDLEARARDVSTRAGAPAGSATLSATVAGAPLSVSVADLRLSPLHLRATLDARGIDAALAALYLPPGSPLVPAHGSVSVSARVDHDASTGALVALEVGLTGLELRPPGQQGAHLSAPAVRVRAENLRVRPGAVELGRLAVDGGTMVLEDSRLGGARRWQVDGIGVEARDLSSVRTAPPGVATARATMVGARIETWVTNVRLAPLELQATTIVRNVDLALLRLYLPPDLPARPERGVVNATMTVAYDMDRGARLGIDAGLSGIELRRPAHVVTAPAVRVTAGDITLDRGAVKVGRLTVAGARLTLAEREAKPARTWTVQDLAVEARDLSSRREDVQGVASLRATVAGASVSAWVTRARLAPVELDATAIVRNIDAELLRLYLPPEMPVDLARGVVNATFHIEHSAADGTRVASDASLTRLRARGRGTLAALRVVSPALRVTLAEGRRRDGVLSAGRIELSGSGSLIDASEGRERFQFSRLSLVSEGLAWPAPTPARVVAEAALPDGGTLKVEGTASTDPLNVDVTLALRNADLRVVQPFLGFRARVAGRVEANLSVAGTLAPSPRLKVTGDAGLRRLDISDGQRSVLTTARLRLVGIDAAWPERVMIDSIRVRRSWVLVERDPQGRFLLRTLLERPASAASVPSGPPAPAAATPPAGPARAPFAFGFREGVFEDQAATVVDGVTTPAARIEVAGARLTVRDFAWPTRAPIRVEVTSPMPAGGRVEVSSTVELDPVRVDARAVLDGVAIEPAQPYLPIEGRVSGKVTGDLAVKIALAPTAVQVTGQARLQAFKLSDGDRAVVTVGRVDTTGVDIDWPRRIGLQGVRLRRPRLLIERDAQGEIRLRRLVTPHWTVTAPADSRPATPAALGAAAPPTAGAQPPTIEIATFALDKASARFVDHTTTPPFAEEIEDLNVSVAPLTTTPGRRMTVTASGVIGGGTFKVQGGGAYGERPTLDLRLDLRDLVVPRANPYLDRYTAWVATSGSLDIAGSYRLDGTQVETRHDLVVHGLEVAPVDQRDEVERRIGLPFGLLVSLLKDARGEIRLSLPVSGDLSRREFDYREAVWGTVRNLTIRLLALPFSKVGSLFFSQDSKVRAVALAPVVFEAGTDRLGPDMAFHLEKVAGFLRGAPSIKVVLDPILTDSDVQALRAGGALPPDGLKALAARRLEVVRQALTRGGLLDPARLTGTARRAPLVEATGHPRVEFDLRR